MEKPESIKKNLEALLSMSARIIDEFTKLSITNIRKGNNVIDINVHFKYYNDIEFDILFKMITQNGKEKLEIHHSSEGFNAVSYHPEFIFNVIHLAHKNDLLIDKTKAVLELLQRGHLFIKKEFFLAKKAIEASL